ncbi:u3 small nucleolar RNA-associated protein 11 [Ramaria rubella]|nr:u3 small nucleolar RNA-associated protein 11 [Ramaria rubella]
MSSLRNSLHRRNHKERSQLAHRSRLGILEKHKDYVKRARDFHSKQDRIKRLKEKAAERNKDEFYFGMHKDKTEGGVHVKDRGNRSLPTDMVKVLKSQDANYIRTVRQAGLKKIDELKAQLSVLVDLMTPGRVGGEDDPTGIEVEGTLDDEDLEVLRTAGILSSTKAKGDKQRRKSSRTKSRHIVFVSHEDELCSYKLPQNSKSPHTPRDGANHHGSTEDLGWEWPEDKVPQKKSNRTVDNGLEKEKSSVGDQGESAATHRRQLLKELAARLKRDVNLRYASRELEMQKLMMGKGATRKIHGVEKAEGEDMKDEDDEDALDARKGKRRKVDVGMEEKPYKPRVYKWRAERKK